MKHKGSISTFSDQLNRDLMAAFRNAKSILGCAPIMQILEYTVNSPAPRFYVSEQRVTDVLYALRNNSLALDSMKPQTREMFMEIISRIRSLQRRYKKKSLPEIIQTVIQQRAPKFYLTVQSAQVKICKIRKLIRQQRQQAASSSRQRSS